MEQRYQILTTLYSIVKDDPQPEKYGCRPRELILRQLQDWNSIRSELETLETEGYVTLKQQDTLVISITPVGLEKVVLVAGQADKV